MKRPWKPGIPSDVGDLSFTSHCWYAVFVWDRRNDQRGQRRLMVPYPCTFISFCFYRPGSSRMQHFLNLTGAPMLAVHAGAFKRHFLSNVKLWSYFCTTHLFIHAFGAPLTHHVWSEAHIWYTALIMPRCISGKSRKDCYDWVIFLYRVICCIIPQETAGCVSGFHTPSCFTHLSVLSALNTPETLHQQGQINSNYLIDVSQVYSNFM